MSLTQLRLWDNKSDVIKKKDDINYPCSLDSMHLNKWKPNHEGHHIDEYHVVFIPIKMHKSIVHNLSTGFNMDAINKLAMRYLKGGPKRCQIEMEKDLEKEVLDRANLKAV